MPLRVILYSLYIINHFRYGERNLPFHCLKSSSFGRPGELPAKSNRHRPCEASAAACWRCKVRWNWKVLRTRWSSPRPLVLRARSHPVSHVLGDEAIATSASSHFSLRFSTLQDAAVAGTSASRPSNSVSRRKWASTRPGADSCPAFLEG